MAEIALILVGTAISAIGQLKAGNDARQAGETAAANEIALADFEADQLEDQAQGDRAAGSVAGKEARRKKELTISRQIALAAGSGAGVHNPTILDIIEDTETRGEVLAGAEIFKAEQKARGILDQADARRVSARGKADVLRKKGKAAQTSARFQAAGTVVGGISKAKFG